MCLSSPLSSSVGDHTKAFFLSICEECISVVSAVSTSLLGVPVDTDAEGEDMHLAGTGSGATAHSQYGVAYRREAEVVSVLRTSPPGSSFLGGGTD